MAKHSTVSSLSRASSKAPKEASPAEEAENVRPTASSPILMHTKDVRAFEHDRQRVKKAADLAKMRARKAQAVDTRMVKSARDAAPSLPSQKEKLLRKEDVDALDGVLSPSVKRRESLLTPAEPTRREVKLEDLVVTQQRKSRKAHDGDFEVVPHVRAVIVLDDNLDVHDMDVDEPWEHITVDDDDETSSSSSDAGEVSYAKIAAGRK